MIIKSPQAEIDRIVSFLKKTFQDQGKRRAVIAVSGGIDSALSLTLLTQAIGAKNVYPLFLPYKDQPVEDSKLIVKWNQIPEENWATENIQSVVDELCNRLEIENWKLEIPRLRRGNIMARVRMICVFDKAKALDALVCGTENKSEHYLGYFTRFGDSASDIEPLCHVYKTQVRQLAEFLKLPSVFLEKAPSAGLWQGQTDEEEMGFTYEEADKAIEKYIQNEKAKTSIEQKVFAAIQKAEFKLTVPYSLSG